MVNNCPMTDSLATDSLAFGHVVLVAHAPLASALLACAAHVFPEALSFVHALDIPADEPQRPVWPGSKRCTRPMGWSVA